MGVHSFMKFVSNGGLYEDQVCIAKKGREHKAKHGLSGDPLLVVDLLNLIRSVWGNLDWVCGGQHAQFELRLRNFIQHFHEKRIRLLFVMDGSCPQDKFHTWLDRKENRISGIDKILQTLREHPRVSNIQTKRIYCLHWSMVDQVLKSLGCEVVCALGDADKRTSEIAQERKAFGILANDADYLFFPTRENIVLFSNAPEHFRLLELAKSNFQKGPWDVDVGYLKTRMIDPEKVALSLGVPRFQMPLLASLVGNDIAQRGKLRLLHEELLMNSRSSLVTTLCSIIREATVAANLSGGDGDALRQIVADETVARKVQRSIDSYVIPSHLQVVFDHNSNEVPSLQDSTSSTWKAVLAVFEQGYVNCESRLLLVMLGHPMQLAIYAEDRRATAQLPFVADLYADLRRRLYGILLMEKPGALTADRKDFTIQVEEWICKRLECVERLREGGPVDLAKPILPPRELHPGLILLHSDSADLIMTRWKLFAHCLSGDDAPDANILANLRPCYIHLFCTLYVMRGSVRDWEIKAFVLQHFMLRKRSSSDVKEMQLEEIDVRAVHLASLYCQPWVSELAFAVGGLNIASEHFLPARNFDGHLFQTNYRRMKRERLRYWTLEFGRWSRDDQDDAEAILNYLFCHRGNGGKRVLRIPRLNSPKL